MSDDSKVILHKGGGTTFQGPDATEWVRATTLVSALSLYAKAKIIPTRGVTATRMLKMATHYTGKKYKRGEHAKAAADVRIWANTMKAALPVEDKRG